VLKARATVRELLPSSILVHVLKSIELANPVIFLRGQVVGNADNAIGFSLSDFFVVIQVPLLCLSRN
jgi:hypothetical protein